MKPLNKIKIDWSSKLAYAVGLIATDGCLYNDGRHLAFISKDLQLIKTFMSCLNLKVKIAKKQSGFVKSNFVYWVQFGDVNFYRFLLSIGLTPNKSKTMGKLRIPDEYFFDFLRGHFDGDGAFYSYWDPRWRSSFMFYMTFVSASKRHILWLQLVIKKFLGIRGHITKSDNQACYQLKYAKGESYKILPKLYCRRRKLCLMRKYLKIKRALAIIGKLI